MLYDLGLVATIAICGWLALDLLTSTGWRRRTLSVAALAVTIALWATGELLLARAGTAREVEWSLRLLYAGVCALPVAWLAVAGQAARPTWWQHAPWVLGAAALPQLFFYSCLYWDEGRLFVDFRHAPPHRGPLFWAMLASAWSLIAAGWVYFGRAALRLGRVSRPRMAALAAGILMPLVGNAVYVVAGALGASMLDPSPVLLGVGALLLVNAVQASGNQPEIEVEVGPVEGGVALRVCDRGLGIPPEVLPRVFDPFFTTKPPGVGMGLGLSLSYDLARRNGGRLEAANRTPSGAEFTLWLPAAG